MDKHYVYGSGSSGCLYDYGPNFSKTKDEAVEDLVWMFSGSISMREGTDMYNALLQNGIYYFKKPREAGADYADVSERDGPMPETDDSILYLEHILSKNE